MMRIKRFACSFVYNCIIPMGFLPWEILVASSADENEELKKNKEERKKDRKKEGKKEGKKERKNKEVAWSGDGQR